MYQFARFATCAALIAGLWMPVHAQTKPGIAVRLTNPPGEADVVAQGPNHELRYYWATPGSSWQSTMIAGSETTYSAPAIAVRVANPTGEADVVAQGPGNEVRYYWATPGSPWQHTMLGE